MIQTTVVRDIRFGLRQIARAPLFSGVVIAVIALGIGINSALLTTLNHYAWRPAPGIQPDTKLARLTPTAQWGNNTGSAETLLSYPDILDLRERRDVFADVAAWASTSLAADFGSGAENVMASYATDNFFRVLRVAMAAGTGFPEGVDRSAAPIAVISHSLWTTNFGESADAIGKTIRVMNLPFTIVGVARPRFTGVDVADLGRASIWIPIGARALIEADTRDDLVRREMVFLESFARLAPGVSADDVGRLTAALAARLAGEEPTSHRGLVIRAERLTGMARGESSTKELVAAFFIVTGLIVIITCTNVSALLLGRAVGRRREIGVRLSLGATRLRIIRQMLTESLILALAGALLGLILYVTIVNVAYATIPELIDGLGPEPATFAFAAVFALVTTFAFGLAPALQATRLDIGEVIKNSGQLGIRRSRLQATFVVIQLVCSQPVLVVTSLVLADIRYGMNADVAAAPPSVIAMYSELLGPRYRGSRDSVTTATLTTLGLVRQRLNEIPGVQSAAIHTSGGGGELFGVPGGADATRQVAQVHVSADYFSTLGIPVVRGRAIGIEDDRRGSVAVVINDEAATLMWPGEDPIGKRLVRRDRRPAAEPTILEVIGVAGTAPYDEDRGAPKVFAPLATGTSLRRPVIAVRTSGGARGFVPAIRAAIREVEPLAAVSGITTLAEQYAFRKREALQVNAAAFAVGAAALLLASLGLYAIIAFAVAQRTREIGVRLAIGATSGQIVQHFFRGGVKVTAIGLAIGLPVTVAAIRLVQANVLGFTLHNVLAVMLVVPILMLIAAIASWLPARRAAQVNPLIALRAE